MALRRYSHPLYIQWCKNILAVLAFLFPPYMIWNSFTSVIPIHTLTEIVVTIFISLFMMIPLLVSAYFWQDIWVNEEGLLIEFLWKKVRVKWDDIIEVKLAWGFLGQESKRPVIVLVHGLTPFHRTFGIIYAFSTKPGFVIHPSISDFQILKETIQSQIRNRV
jgi:hypothetical protein